MEFCVDMRKLVKGIYGIDIGKDLLESELDYDSTIIHGTRQEAIEFYKYVDNFKDRYPRYKDLDNKIFIEAANMRDELLNTDSYTHRLTVELEYKMHNIFTLMNELSQTDNEMFNINVDGNVYYENILIPFNLAAFSGDNSFNKLTTIIMAAETLKSEKIKDFSDWEKFYSLDLLGEEYTDEKAEILENHLVSLGNLRELKVLREFTKINTVKENYKKKEWNYEFDVEDLEYIIFLYRNNGLI